MLIFFSRHSRVIRSHRTQTQQQVLSVGETRTAIPINPSFHRHAHAVTPVPGIDSPAAFSAVEVPCYDLALKSTAEKHYPGDSSGSYCSTRMVVLQGTALVRDYDWLRPQSNPHKTTCSEQGHWLVLQQCTAPSPDKPGSHMSVGIIIWQRTALTTNNSKPSKTASSLKAKRMTARCDRTLICVDPMTVCRDSTLD